MKRGVFLACIFYTDDRVLVTTEDNVPIVEVDESYPGAALHADYQWMLKVACTWDDVKVMHCVIVSIATTPQLKDQT